MVENLDEEPVAPPEDAGELSALDSDVRRLVARLVALPSEGTWVEFKVGNEDPDMIGEYISALANSAALERKRRGYVVWGVEDETHELVGTDFDPAAKTVSGEELQNYLTRNLNPHVFFQFQSVEADEAGPRLVVLAIDAAAERPVAFRSTEFIRIGSYKKKLAAHPDHERRLWRLFDKSAYEASAAAEGLSVQDVVQLIDYPSYFRMTGQPLPESRSHIIEILAGEGIISYDVESEWTITNLGALLFAVDLRGFDHLARKAPRVVVYRGTSRVQTIREQVGQRGYAAGFEGFVNFVTDLLPENEVIGKALRTSESWYPELAVRELLANAVVHQDLTIPGTGPMVEIFDDRVEITNPGIPLVPSDRFIDSPPQSRNERLARAMRRLGVCEERGSGWDKVAFEIEYHQLPAPLVEVTDAHTKVVMFAPKPLKDMERDDRIRAVYVHACLKYVNREPMTNTSVRRRFGISDRNSAQASRLIRDAVEAGVIVPYDPTVGPRALRYIPMWAEPGRASLS